MAIRVGDTFKRTYTFYNPLEEDPNQPDLNNPIDLTGSTLDFVIQHKDGEFKYGDDSGYLTITPLLGQVAIEIPEEETDRYAPYVGQNVTTHLEHEDTLGRTKSKAQRVEPVYKQGQLAE